MENHNQIPGIHTKTQRTQVVISQCGARLSINSLGISSHPTDRNDGKPYNGALYKNSKVDEWKSHRKFLWELRCTYPDHSSLVNCLGTKSSWSLWQRKLSWISWLNDKNVIPIDGDPMTHTSCRESILMFILRVVPKKSLNAPVGMLFFIYSLLTLVQETWLVWSHALWCRSKDKLAWRQRMMLVPLGWQVP